MSEGTPEPKKIVDFTARKADMNSRQQADLDAGLELKFKQAQRLYIAEARKKLISLGAKVDEEVASLKNDMKTRDLTKEAKWATEQMIDSLQDGFEALQTHLNTATEANSLASFDAAKVDFGKAFSELEQYLAE